ncbi:MAG: hypothetical protein IKY83_05600, partial [Proteobacteria bacterium]|nr:hypothetical protein [Pseudomonadota bacterium]
HARRSRSKGATDGAFETKAKKAGRTIKTRRMRGEAEAKARRTAHLRRRRKKPDTPKELSARQTKYCFYPPKYHVSLRAQSPVAGVLRIAIY